MVRRTWRGEGFLVDAVLHLAKASENTSPTLRVLLAFECGVVLPVGGFDEAWFAVGAGEETRDGLEVEVGPAECDRLRVEFRFFARRNRAAIATLLNMCEG